MKKILMEDIKINKSYRQIPSRVSKLNEKEKEKDLIPRTENLLSKKQKPARSFKRMSVSPRISSNKPIRGFLKVLLILSFLGGLVYWIGFFFSSAYVTITAKHQNIEYKSKVFSANKKINNNFVEFEIMMESEKKLKDYVLTENKEVSSKASGRIILFNEFSTKPEKLIQGTYISDQDGKTYRLDSTVTIPGYKLEKQKKIPGQAEVGITSFLAGENYNGNPEKFLVNSFKGTTKYSKIYGKLKTELKGGLQGTVYYVSEDDKIKLRNIAESSFKDELYGKLKALLPSGYLLYPGAIKFSYEIDNNVLSETPEIKIPIEGKIAAVLIKEDSLSRNIMRISLPEVTKEERVEIILNNLKNLEFSFVVPQLINKDLESFDFYISGNIEAVWNPNKDNIKRKLAGLHKDQVLPVFRESKGVAKALIKIFPPWDKHVPKNPSKINIKIQ